MPDTALARSSYCRRDEHRTCKDVQAKCGCTCHGPGGQTMTPTTTPLRPASPAPAGRNGTPPPGTSGLIWEDPPEARHRRGEKFTAEVRDALKARPGAWARVADYTYKSGAHSKAKAIRAAWPGFEAVGRTTPTGSALYARWAGK